MRPKALPVNKRGLALLRLMALCGPLTHKQAERALGAFVPDLLGRKTTSRLLYRELAALVRARLLENRRVLGTNTSVYGVTPRAAAVLEANGDTLTDLDFMARYLATPWHEHLVRDVLVEFVRLRSSTAEVTALSWSLTERFYVGVLHGSGDRYEPDLVLGVETRSVEYTIVVEVDRGTESLSVWDTKVAKASLVLSRLPEATRMVIFAGTEQRLDSLLTRSGIVLGARRAILRGRVASDLTSANVLEDGYRAWNLEQTTLI